MKFISKLAAVAAVTTLAVGGGATAASAYSISGGTFTATTSSMTFAFGGSYVYRCSSVSMAGSATGADTTSFTPSFSGCTMLGFPIFVTQSGDWNLKVTGGTAPNFTGELGIPAGTTTTMSVPIMGCTWVYSGPQTFQHGVGGNVVTMVNTGTGANLTTTVNGIAYTATGCPFSSASNGVLNSNGAVAFPGITVS